jgi:Xaa-Pro dipeptidase
VLACWHGKSAEQQSRTSALLQAQQKADELFRAIESRGLIRPHVLESQLNQVIYDLAKAMFGISTYWHKRIVRADATPWRRTTKIHRT